MKLSKIQLNKINQFARRIYRKNNDPSHDFDHAVMVSKFATCIARKEKADVNVCRVAGLLHDLAPKTRGKPHGKSSAQLARKFLKRLNLDKEFINQVYLAIIYHDYATHHLIRTKEGQVVLEADKINAFGPIGLIREYGDLIIKGYKPKEALEVLVDYLKNYDLRFTTKTGKKFKKEFRQLNIHFLKLYNKYY